MSSNIPRDDSNCLPLPHVVQWKMSTNILKGRVYGKGQGLEEKFFPLPIENRWHAYCFNLKVFFFKKIVFGLKFF